MKSLALAIALLLSTCASAALPGVTELGASPEKLTDAQLAPLIDSRIAPAAVIAIGETVHGSSGLLRVQARLIRYLVEKHGLRLIVWENPALRSRELSRWVAACAKARTAAPVDVLYMPTPADVAFLDWVCEFNRSSTGNPIIFRGMDVWDRPWEHYARIRSLGTAGAIDGTLLKTIAALCPAHRASSWPEVDDVLARPAHDGKFLPDADYEKCRAALAAVLDAARRAGRALRENKDPGYEDALELAISASTLLGWLGFYHYNWSNDVLSWNERDTAQGMNLALVMEKHGATRAILSAHTSHVSHNRSPADWWGFGDIKSGVFFFTKLTGKQVFSIALTAYEASGTQGAWSLPVARNSVDRKLHDSGHAFSFFASNAAFLSEHPKWWIQNQNYPGPYESGVEIVPGDHFDAFFWLDRSLLDRALPARPMWQP